MEEVVSPPGVLSPDTKRYTISNMMEDLSVAGEGPIETQDTQMTPNIYVVIPHRKGRHDTALIWLFKLLNSNGLSNEEQELYRRHLPYKLFSGLAHTLSSHIPASDLALLGPALESKAQSIISAAAAAAAAAEIEHKPTAGAAHPASPPQELLDIVVQLLPHPLIQKGFCSSWSWESLEYFNPASLTRIFSPTYVPTSLDTIYAQLLGASGGANPCSAYDLRLTTPEGKTYAFLSSAATGSYCNRKKLRSLLEVCNAVVFIADLCDYDKPLWENDEDAAGDKSGTAPGSFLRNVIDNHFRSIVDPHWFHAEETCFVLLLTNSRAFGERVASGTRPLERAFPGYTGGADAALAREFVLEQFTAARESSERPLYVHFMEDVADESAWAFLKGTLDAEEQRRESKAAAAAAAAGEDPGATDSSGGAKADPDPDPDPDPDGGLSGAEPRTGSTKTKTKTKMKMKMKTRRKK